MSDDKNTTGGCAGCPYGSCSDLKSLFDGQRAYMDRRFDTQQAFLIEHSSTMGAHIVSGFEKVGDKLIAEIKDMKMNLLPSATNERKVDIKVMMPIIYTLCGVIGSLIIWFTGVKPFIPQAEKIVVESVIGTVNKP